jgi:hypothetical protein
VRAAATQDADCELDRASEAQRERWFESNCHHHPEKLEKSGFSFFLFSPGGTHLPYTKFGVGKVTVHLISQTFDVNEIAGRCKQGAGKPNNPFPVKYCQNNITGHVKKQKTEQLAPHPA